MISHLCTPKMHFSYEKQLVFELVCGVFEEKVPFKAHSAGESRAIHVRLRSVVSAVPKVR